MSLVDVPVQHNLAFEPVPEVSAGDLPEVLSDIAERRQRNLPTYGAYIFRSCGMSLAGNIVLGVNSLYPAMDYEMKPNEHLEDTDSSVFQLGLHWDPGSENDVTAHITKEGAAEFVMLCVNSRRESIRNNYVVNLDLRSQLAKGIFEQQTYDLPVERALHTNIGINDILLFDHTNPHAFRTTEKPRNSYATYYVPTNADFF